MSEPSLNICCFRFVPPELKQRTEEVEAFLYKLNQAIEMALAEDRRALVSGTELQGKRGLRSCIVNHRVTQTGVEETLVLLQEFGYNLDKQIRERDF